MPTFDRQNHISRCLESIVGQARTDAQVLVVDNASTDQTVEIALGFNKVLDIEVLVNERNRERSYSRNRGAMQARGQFQVFLDSDDELTPGALDRTKRFRRRIPIASSSFS